MRRIVLSLLALSLVIAAPASAKKDYGLSNLLGPWEGDVLAMLDATGVLAQMPPNFDPTPMLEQFSMTLNFNEDSTVLVVNKTMEGEDKELHPFEIVEADGAALHLKSADENGGELSVFITFQDDDTIQVQFTDSPPATYKRVKDKKADKAKMD